MNNIFHQNKIGVVLSNSGGVTISHNLFLESSTADILKIQKVRDVVMIDLT